MAYYRGFPGQRKVPTTQETGGVALIETTGHTRDWENTMNELRNDYGITTFEYTAGSRMSDVGNGLDLFGGEMDGYDWLGEVASRLSGDSL